MARGGGGGTAIYELYRYREIQKISTGAYIFQTPFLRGLFLEGLIYGRREICVLKSIGLASQLEVNLHFRNFTVCVAVKGMVFKQITV